MHKLFCSLLTPYCCMSQFSEALASCRASALRLGISAAKTIGTLVLMLMMMALMVKPFVNPSHPHEHDTTLVCNLDGQCVSTGGLDQMPVSLCSPYCLPPRPCYPDRCQILENLRNRRETEPNLDIYHYCPEPHKETGGEACSERRMADPMVFLPTPRTSTTYFTVSYTHLTLPTSDLV